MTPTLMRRVGASAGTIVDALTHPPYGWGEHRDFESHADHGSVAVTFEDQPVVVEYYHFPAGPHAPTVFICNGFTANAGVYGPLGKAVWHHEHNVVLLSLPGHGGTTLPMHRPLGYADTAEIMISAIEAIRHETGMVGEIILAGHSHGGGVAMAIAVRLGQQANRLILLASVGGPEWSRITTHMQQSLDGIRACHPNLGQVSRDLQVLAMLFGEGLLMVPPPWDAVNAGKELILPFARGFRGWRRPLELWSVAIDTIVGDAYSLESDLAQVKRLGIPTACVAGKLDGVINRKVIRQQAKLAGAGEFHYTTTHASFLAPEARRRIAELITLPDDSFKLAVEKHLR